MSKDPRSEGIVRDEGRMVGGAANALREVTLLRPAEKARAHLAAIVESSDDAIVSKDLTGVITTWNRGAERLFGYAAAEAIGQSVMMLIPPERYDEEPIILARVRHGERVESYETVRRRKDGVQIDVALTVSPIIDAHGRIIGASKIARDITERKRAEQQREEALRLAERAREQAEAANRAKDEFLAMLAHELRNPLAAVRNAVAVALLDAANRPRALEIARRQTDHLRRLVDDLLDIARITRGHVPLHQERLSLGDVLQRTVDGAGAAMEERGHTVSLAVPADPIYVSADATRLEQAVGNLLANAAKFTNPGGTVTVTAQRDGSDAVIRVRDNGIGIAPDVLPRVFDLFAQADRSLDRAEGGLGIGLTLVHRIAELHGGSVAAHSDGVGRGAEFVIRLPALPAAAEASAAAASARSAVSGAHQPARILVVEDNADTADSLSMLLEIFGHHVRVVHDGLAALAMARANVPDAMVIDIGLPGMSGYEVARAVRREPSLARVVLVALTGYGRSEDTTDAMAAGFDYHLVKPVDVETLRDLVGRLGG